MKRPSPFGKYILLERISVGGMAEVFKGRTFGIEGFARYVAIKRILPHLAEDPRFVDMFIDEAKLQAALNHANIVQVIELGLEGRDHFIAMEYVPGKDALALYHHLRRSRSRMPVQLAAQIGLKVAEGLDYAHRKRGPDGPLGIVHRDVSPQNVLVSYDGAVKLIDFGIAKADRPDAEATKAGVLKGKFGYMSPELIEARRVDARSDIFSLGAVLWELLCGERLFSGDNEFVTLELVRRAEVDPPSLRNPAVPPELDRIILRALAREADQRYQFASDLSDDLGRFLHGQGFGSDRKALAVWMRTEFVAALEAEQRKSLEHARLTMGPDGQVVEAPDDEEEEPTALWQPDAEMAEEWARATAPPEEHEEVIDPLAALDPSAELRHRPTAPRPRAESMRPTEPQSLATRPTANLRQAGVRPGPARSSGRAALVLALVVGLLATAAAAWFLLQPTARGTLMIRVTPADRLSVRLDETILGDRGPLKVEGLTPGQRTLEVTRPGYSPWREPVVLVGGEVTDVEVVLRPALAARAVLRFEVGPADAQVLVNGIEVKGGRYELEAGRPARIRISKDGYATAEFAASPEPGDQLIRRTLQPTPGSLFVDSEPPGAVFVGGERRGRTPASVGGLDVSQPWPVRIEAPGHIPYETVVEFGARRFVQIEAKLSPK